MFQREKALLVARSYAKVNLFLKVLRKREDAYHDIFSFVVKISLHDILFFNRTPSKGIYLSSNSKDIPLDDRNSVRKAATVFMKHLSLQNGVNIYIEKHIPIGSGLGGESSNSATTLLALNKLFEAKLSNEELHKLGEKIGGDVCFFLNGNSALIYGKGDKTIPTILRKKLWFVMVIQNFPILSKDVYNMWDKTSKTKYGRAIHLFYNDLDFKYPETEEAKRLLLQEGCISAGLTGSGPTVVGITFSKEKAELISNRLRKAGLNAIVASTLS